MLCLSTLNRDIPSLLEFSVPQVELATEAGAGNSGATLPYIGSRATTEF